MGNNTKGIGFKNFRRFEELSTIRIWKYHVYGW